MREVLSEHHPEGVEAWKKRDVALRSLRWDFPFLLAYASLLAVVVLLAAQQAPELRRLNVLFSLAPFPRRL